MANPADHSGTEFTRREALSATASAGLLALAGFGGAGMARAAVPVPRELAGKFEDRAWKLRILTRIEGERDPRKQIHGFNTGTLYGVRDGEPLRPLFGYEVFSSIRLIPQNDGTIQRLNREVVFYRDLATGKMLDEWENVYTGERVRVVDVANNPFNYKLTLDGPETSKASVMKEAGRAERWYMLNENTVAFEREAHLHYPSMLKPDVWKRESPGEMTRVSEFMRFSIRLEDLLAKTDAHLPHTGSWIRVTPWLPWMLMDQAPGHAIYVGMFSTRRDASLFAPEVLERLRARYPEYLNAPDKWSEPSYSSLEHYAMEQKPAPPRK